MNEISRKPAQTVTVTELASARQHQEKRKNWPTIMERAVEGIMRCRLRLQSEARGARKQKAQPERNARAKWRI